MANYKMVNADQLDADLTLVANVIRSKGGTSAYLSFPNGFESAIESIETGVDTSDATASASDILSGKTAYVDGEKVTGSIETKTSSNLTASGATVTVPAGYYASNATKSVATATQATPSISVSSAGKITASATQTAGYVSAGTKSATKQLTVQAAKTVTPSTSNQTAVASGRYTTGAVTVKGDSNLVAGNIKSGTSIFGVTGTCPVMPDEISAITTGTFTITSDNSSSYTITHNLGVKPTFLWVIPTGEYVLDDNVGYVLYFCINFKDVTGTNALGTFSSEYEENIVYVSSNEYGYPVTNVTTGFYKSVSTSAYTIYLSTNAKLKAGTTYRYVALATTTSIN